MLMKMRWENRSGDTSSCPDKKIGLIIRISLHMTGLKNGSLGFSIPLKTSIEWQIDCSEFFISSGTFSTTNAMLTSKRQALGAKAVGHSRFSLLLLEDGEFFLDV